MIEKKANKRHTMDTHYRPSFSESGLGFPTAESLKRKSLGEHSVHSNEKRIKEGDFNSLAPRSGGGSGLGLTSPVGQSYNQGTAASVTDSPEYGQQPAAFSLLGDDITELDQTEEDELSQIDWSQGRRRGVSGLLTCVLDRRRQREPNARKKKVRFVSDERLVKVQLFEMDENERHNVFTAGQMVGAIDGKSGIDIKKSDSQSERKSMEHAVEENSQKTSATDESPWYTPLLLSGLPPPLVVRGKDSVEKVVVLARQSGGSLATLLHNREDLPDAPEEPTESLVPKGTNFDQLKTVPLLRAGMIIGQTLTLTPHGPLQPPAGELPMPQPVPVAPAPAPYQPYSSSLPGQFQAPPQPYATAPVAATRPPDAVTEPGKTPTMTADLIARLLKSHKDSLNAGQAQASTSYQAPPANPTVHSYSTTASVRPEGHMSRYPGPNQQYPSQSEQRSPGLESRSAPWFPPNNSQSSQGQYSFPAPQTGYNQNAPPPRMSNGHSGTQLRRPMRPCLYETRPNRCRNGSACTFWHDPNLK